MTQENGVVVPREFQTQRALIEAEWGASSRRAEKNASPLALGTSQLSINHKIQSVQERIAASSMPPPLNPACAAAERRE